MINEINNQNNDEIEIIDIWRFFQRQFAFIAVITFSLMAIALVYGITRPTVWQSSVSLIIGEKYFLQQQLPIESFEEIKYKYSKNATISQVKNTRIVEISATTLSKEQSLENINAAENQIHQQQLDETQRELAFNRKQLEDFTFHLLEKNKIISELENKSLITKGEQENGEDGDEFASLLQLKILTEEDWTRFKLYFDKAFPGLILKLRNEYPNLTGAEQRLFLLIKLKNDSREMSEMLGISMDSVRKNKYRLKKKLHLDEDLSLEDFIQIFK